MLRQKYYTSFNDFCYSCIKNNINNIGTYKLNLHKDEKLPPYKFINNGFYYDIMPKLNLTTLNINDVSIDDIDF